MDPCLLEYAKQKISEIYLKIHKLNKEAISTLEMLQQEKVKSAIWTNNIREIDHWFDEINLYRYINRESIVNSYDLGVNKPNMKFYYAALNILKTNPQSILFLDDREENRIGARKCGIISTEYTMEQSLQKTVEREIRRLK